MVEGGELKSRDEVEDEVEASAASSAGLMEARATLQNRLHPTPPHPPSTSTSYLGTYLLRYLPTYLIYTMPTSYSHIR